MAFNAPRPAAMPEIDHNDLTVEFDVRGLVSDKSPHPSQDASSTESIYDDTHFNEFTETQVNELLVGKK